LRDGYRLPAALADLRSVPAVAKGHVVMGLLFFPRGGSAQVARYLPVALVHADWSIELVTGSLGDLGEETHAPMFFAGTPLHHLDYSDAMRAFAAGGSAIGQQRPSQ
jgi:hypothetical protein